MRDTDMGYEDFLDHLDHLETVADERIIRLVDRFYAGRAGGVVTAHMYIGSDGQVHARFTCERTDCTTWDRTPVVHGTCTACGGRTHRGLLGASWGQYDYGCASCASSLHFTQETWQDADGITCAGCSCGDEVYRASLPTGRTVWFHSQSGTPACTVPVGVS